MKYFKNIKTPEEAKKRFYKLSQKYHPDKQTGNSKKFIEMEKEYKELLVFFKVSKARNGKIIFHDGEIQKRIKINKDYADNIIKNAGSIASDSVKIAVETLLNKFFEVK